jgi:digeranylgeranylglycerophospholipid reductase
MVGDVRASVVVVATGASLPFVSGVQRDALAGPSVLSVRGYYDDVDGLTDAVEFVMDRRVLPGYFWVFPTGPRSANVGVASYVPGLDLASELAWFLGQHPRGRALGKVRRRGPVKGGVIPVLSKCGSRMSRGVMYVGDAGWFCDPLMFHGLGPAIWSGALAARVALDALGRGLVGRDLEEALGAYDGAWRRQFGTRSLFLAMSLLDGVNPLGGEEEEVGPVRLRTDAAVQYEALVRMFAQGD